MSDFDHEMARMAAQAKDIMSGYEKALNLLVPFAIAYRKTAEPVGDSDLCDEQPHSITVTLGDCRRASRFFQEITSRQKG